MKYNNLSQKPTNQHRINNDIRANEVRLIGADGTQLGIKSRLEALRIAELKNLDLVEVVPNANPPVCKIIDYGKHLYEEQKRVQDKKKAQVVQVLKEIRFKWRTDTHDFNFKVNHARGFIEEGNKVKASVMFRGREITHQEIGRDLLERFVEAMSDISKVDQTYRLDGKHMSVVISPIKANKPITKPVSSSAVMDDELTENIEAKTKPQAKIKDKLKAILDEL